MSLLRRADDFGRFFRYRAAFEDTWPGRRPVSGLPGRSRIRRVRRRSDRGHRLPPLDPSGVARLVEEGARHSGGEHQRAHLSADLVAPYDLVVEAGRLAQTQAPNISATSQVTTRAHIDAVIARRRQQQGGLAQLLRERILSGSELVPTTGAAIGQINGIGVYAPPPVERRVAVPFRISVTVSPGRERLVDIEREAGTVDSSHVSGALTIAGYLAHRYGSQRQISVVARLRFEQEEGGNGNSASAAALFALLSALADSPIFCARAVTGAVGQYGDLQTIGAVNEKIEGFWEVCRLRRDAGETPSMPYGIIIPAANAHDLMLRREVAASIANDGWFSVWPAAAVDEALPLLTGLSATEIHTRVDRRLQRFAELAQPPASGR